MCMEKDVVERSRGKGRNVKTSYAFLPILPGAWNGGTRSFLPINSFHGSRIGNGDSP